VHVARGAEVVDAVVMQDAVVGPGARVDRAILDKCARVGEGAVIGDGDVPRAPGTAWLEGLTLVGKDAVIPEGARIGRAAVIGIGAREGELGSLAVAPGTVIGSRPWYQDVL
jgi:glucose-1-phosphate adenylyltransferase